MIFETELSLPTVVLTEAGVRVSRALARIHSHRDEYVLKHSKPDLKVGLERVVKKTKKEKLASDSTKLFVIPTPKICRRQIGGGIASTKLFVLI